MYASVMYTFRDSKQENLKVSRHTALYWLSQKLQAAMMGQKSEAIIKSTLYIRALTLKEADHDRN